MISNNLCFRCGKQRVISKIYTEVIDGASITYTETICPDAECQRLVDLQLAAEKVKRDRFTANKIETEAAHVLERKLKRSGMMSD